MKKSIKVILIILVILIGIIIIDTIQSKVFNNRPIIRIRKNLDGGIIDYIDYGILVRSYCLVNSERKTVFNWEKYSMIEKMKDK